MFPECPLVFPGDNPIMKKLSLLTFGIKNLRRRPFRTGVLAFSISLVACLLVFGLSFVVSVTSGIKRSSDRLGADLLVIPVGASRIAEEVLLETEARSFYMDKSVIARLEKIEGIEQITYQTYLTTIPGLCCDIPEAKIVAFNQDSDFIIKPWLHKAIGRRLNRGEAIVGYESFLNIGRGLMEVDANLFGTRFTILGSLEKTGTGLDNAIFIGEESVTDILREGKSALKAGQISIILTRVKKGYDPYVVGRAVEGEIVDVDVIARKDIGKSIIGTLKDLRQLFVVLIVMTSLMSLFLAWSIFSAIAGERSREVGIMRAMGARKSHIVLLFLTEVFAVGAAGSVVGVLSGSALSLLLEKNYVILKTLSNGITGSDRLSIAAAGLVTGVVICAVGALSPIWRLKSLEPLAAIKKE